MAKRFRTRQHWYRARTWALVSSVAVALCLLFLGHAVPYNLMLVVVGAAMGGLFVALMLDRANAIVYIVERERMTLVRADRREELAMAQLIDANVLDGVHARDYAIQHLRRLEEDGRPRRELRRMKQELLRYCTENLGLGMFPLLPKPTQQSWQGRKDLVLLRIRDGREMLLSPIHHQDMVDAIVKLLQKPAAPTPEAQQRA